MCIVYAAMFFYYTYLQIAGLIQECGKDEFQCNITLVCIPLDYTCDNHLDCGSGDTSDEDNCIATSKSIN